MASDKPGRIWRVLGRFCAMVLTTAFFVLAVVGEAAGIFWRFLRRKP